MAVWASVLALCLLVLAGTSLRTSGSHLHSSTQEDPKVQNGVLFNRTKCYEELGCFSIEDDFFDILHRPINLLPQDRHVINTHFRLFTRKEPTLEYVMRTKDESSIKLSDFDGSRKTKLVVHGFVDKMDYEVVHGWMRNLKDALLEHGDYNVIIVDWSGGNKLPYSQAVANTRVVGAEVAIFLQKLQDLYGLNMSDVHIIGHCLGAHIAGYAGERINKIGRITGLDPAGPFFEKMPPSVRLDPTDAQFVDAIHTDANPLWGLGIMSPSGHLDFYPNGGDNQPGCAFTTSLTSLVFDLDLIGGGKLYFVCDHYISIDLFRASLNRANTCHMVGRKCKDWETFQAEECNECGLKGEKCAYMGIDARKLPLSDNQSSLFLKTSKNESFCLFTYQIFVIISDDPTKESRDEHGAIYVTLHGKNGNIHQFQLTNGNEYIYPGAIFKKEVQAEEPFEEIPFVTFKWIHKSKLTELSTWSILRKPTLQVRHIKIIPTYTLDDKEIKIGTRLFCGSDKPIPSGEEVSYITNVGC